MISSKLNILYIAMSFLHTNWKCSTTNCIRMFMVDLFMTDQIGANATSPRRARLATCRKKGTSTSQVNLIDFSLLHQLDYFFFFTWPLVSLCGLRSHSSCRQREQTAIISVQGDLRLWTRPGNRMRRRLRGLCLMWMGLCGRSILLYQRLSLSLQLLWASYLSSRCFYSYRFVACIYSAGSSHRMQPGANRYPSGNSISHPLLCLTVTDQYVVFHNIICLLKWGESRTRGFSLSSVLDVDQTTPASENDSD